MKRLHAGDDRYSLEYVVLDDAEPTESDVMPSPPEAREVERTIDVAPELFDFTELGDLSDEEIL